MAMKSLGPASKGVRIGVLVAVVVGLASSLVAWSQYQRERRIDEDDLNRRAHVLAHQRAEPIRKTLTFPAAEAGLALKTELGRPSSKATAGCSASRYSGPTAASSAPARAWPSTRS